MKLTVNQLRRIIKEEVRRSLRESAVTAEDVEDVWMSLYNMCPDGNVDSHEVTETVEQVALLLGMDSEKLKAILNSTEWKDLQSDRDNCIGFDGKKITFYPI